MKRNITKTEEAVLEKSMMTGHTTLPEMMSYKHSSYEKPLTKAMESLEEKGMGELVKSKIVYNDVKAWTFQISSKGVEAMEELVENKEKAKKRVHAFLKELHSLAKKYDDVYVFANSHIDEFGVSFDIPGLYKGPEIDTHQELAYVIGEMIKES